MSKVAIQGAATGTGVFTLASPATNTDRTLVLPDEAGTVLTTAGVPASAMPAGSVIQVVSATATGATSTTGNTYVATNLAVSITPSSASSKILVFGQMFLQGTANTTQPNITLYRSGTELIGSYGLGNFYGTNSGYFEAIAAFSLLDSPATTASRTYTIYGRNPSNAGTANFGDNARVSVITALEIAA
jgi:hypothetical protein